MHRLTCIERSGCRLLQDPQLRAGKYWWEARAAGGDTPRHGSTETAAGDAANTVKGAVS
ncbi:hypothetical protein [Burkholderia ubonensis]|uniref:hypothetical protein n=1 Tax=Burkholderia ubonensis TaxID=101571 RepID=UPI000A4AA617|nr:hypothetical protein [Burkholderia ubonensis]